MRKGDIRAGLQALGIMMIVSSGVVFLTSFDEIFPSASPVSIENSSINLSAPQIEGYTLTMDDPLGSWPITSALSTATSHESISVESSSAAASSTASVVTPSSKASSKSSSKASSKASPAASSKTSAAPVSSVAASSVASVLSSVASSSALHSSALSSQTVSSPSSALSQTITLTLNGSTQTLTYAEVLKGIVGKEISKSYHDEAIKAQIAACYTFLRYYADRGAIPSVSAATAATLSSTWGSAGLTRLDKLISEVGGKLITLNGKPILATYCAMSAGKTNNATDVWGGSKDAFGNPMTYLVTVDSHWDETASKFMTTPVLTSAQVKTAVQTALGITLTGDPSGWLAVNTRNTAGYVLSLNVGSGKTTGRILRENVLNAANVGDKALRSAAFEIAYSVATDSFTFTVRGYGHGVGMSQVGANGMALEGSTWQQILKHYYTGVTVE